MRPLRKTKLTEYRAAVAFRLLPFAVALMFFCGPSKEQVAETEEAIAYLEWFGTSRECRNNRFLPAFAGEHLEGIPELPEQKKFTDWGPGPYFILRKDTLITAHQDSQATLTSHPDIASLQEHLPQPLSAHRCYFAFEDEVSDSSIKAFFRKLTEYGIGTVRCLYVKSMRNVELHAPDSEQVRRYKERIAKSEFDKRAERFAALQYQEIRKCPSLRETFIHYPSFSPAERHHRTIAALREALGSRQCNVPKVINLYYMFYLPWTSFSSVEYDLGKVAEGTQRIVR